jgi:hypothetical protein
VLALLRACGAGIGKVLSCLVRGGVAQLGERLLCKQEVVGSIPSTSTRSWPSSPEWSGGLVSFLEGLGFVLAGSFWRSFGTFWFSALVFGIVNRLQSAWFGGGFRAVFGPGW